VSAFERYDADTYESFAELQRDVDRLVDAMTAHIPRVEVDGTASLDRVTRDVAGAIEGA